MAMCTCLYVGLLLGPHSASLQLFRTAFAFEVEHLIQRVSWIWSNGSARHVSILNAILHHAVFSAVPACPCDRVTYVRHSQRARALNASNPGIPWSPKRVVHEDAGAHDGQHGVHEGDHPGAGHRLVALVWIRLRAFKPLA